MGRPRRRSSRRQRPSRIAATSAGLTRAVAPPPSPVCASQPRTIGANGSARSVPSSHALDHSRSRRRRRARRSVRLVASRSTASAVDHGGELGARASSVSREPSARPSSMRLRRGSHRHRRRGAIDVASRGSTATARPARPRSRAAPRRTSASASQATVRNGRMSSATGYSAPRAGIVSLPSAASRIAASTTSVWAVSTSDSALGRRRRQVVAQASPPRAATATTGSARGARRSRSAAR